MAFHLYNFEVISDISKLCGLVMSRRVFSRTMGTGFSSLEIRKEAESREDQLEKRDLKYLN